MLPVNAASLRRAAAVLAAAAVVAVVPPALAQDKALAESLFNAGKTALEAGDYKTACKNFAESQKQDPSVGTLLNLGRCNELQGRLATAWGHYKEAARFAQLRGDPERSEAARRLATELEPKLSKLTVAAAEPVPGMIVARIRKDDGERVQMSSGALGVALDVDAGAYVIEASAPGHQTWSGEITVGASADRQTISIPALAPAPADAPVPTPPPGAGATTVSTDGGSDGSGLVTAGLIVGGVGVVGVGLGAIFGIMASSTASGAEDDPALCPNKQCSAAGLDEIDSAETSATISTIGFGVGAAALAGGAVLLVLGLSQDGEGTATETGALHVDPVASPEGGGLWLSGAF